MNKLAMPGWGQGTKMSLVRVSPVTTMVLCLGWGRSRKTSRALLSQECSKLNSDVGGSVTYINQDVFPLHLAESLS